MTLGNFTVNLCDEKMSISDDGHDKFHCILYSRCAPFIGAYLFVLSYHISAYGEMSLSHSQNLCQPTTWGPFT